MNQVFLIEVQSAKYLGVLLSSDMSWSPHISSIVHNAHQRLGFIRRNLRGSPFKYREIAYQSLVRSQLKYCATIWDRTLKCDITKLEQIQRKAARWARGQYGIVSVTRLLRDLGPFSISLLKLSQLKAKSWSQPSNLLQTGFLSCAQVSDLCEILTWDSS